MAQRETGATKRIPLTAETFQRVHDFQSGADITYDQAIDYLLSIVENQGETSLEAGLRLRGTIKRTPPR